MQYGIQWFVNLLQICCLSHPNIQRISYIQKFQNQKLFSTILIGLSLYRLLDETTNQIGNISIITLNTVSLVFQHNVKTVSITSLYLRDFIWLAILTYWLEIYKVSILNALMIHFIYACSTIYLFQVLGTIIWVISIFRVDLMNSTMIELTVVSILILFVQLKQSFNQLDNDIKYQELQCRLDMDKAIFGWISQNIDSGVILIRQLRQVKLNNDRELIYVANEAVMNLNPQLYNFIAVQESRRKASGEQYNLNDLLQNPKSDDQIINNLQIIYHDSDQICPLTIQSKVVIINDQKFLILINKPLDDQHINATLIASLNHKLKTSLSAGLVYLSSADQDPTVDIKIKQQYITPALNNCKVQLYQVQDVLDFLTLDKEVMYAQRKGQNIITITLNAMQYVYQQCHRKQIQLNLIVNNRAIDQSNLDQDHMNVEPLKFFTDENKLQRILLNLLNNSYRNTMNGGEITIKIDSDQSSAQFSISDTGSGMTSDKIIQLNRLFTHTMESKQQTILNAESIVGIGLMITNKMIMTLNNHGKPLQLEETQLGGLKAVFTIENIENLKGSIHSKSLQMIENYRSQTLHNNRPTKFSAINNIFSPLTKPHDTSLDNYDEPPTHQLPTLTITPKLNPSSILQQGNTQTRRTKKLSYRKVEQHRQFTILQKSTISVNSPLNSPDHKSTKLLQNQARSSIKIRHMNTLVQQYPLDKQDSHKVLPPCLYSLAQIDQGYAKDGKIIIVDDEPFNHTSLQLMLKALNCPDIIHLYNGQQFINQINSKPMTIRAVLMDVDMPIMDGITATRITIQLQETQQLPLFPIIGCTAHQDQFTQDQCLSAGMVAVLTKPVFKKQLLDVLKYIEESIESHGKLIQFSSKCSYENQ